jgi:agmatine deiminase
MATPAELGFRMPAEWEPHDAVWFSWPHPDTESFPGAYDRIPRAMGALIRAAADFEPVRVNVRNTAEEVEARRHIGKCDSVEFFPIDTDEPWCRDHGPIFLVNDRTGEVAVADFEFNSWGRKLPRWELDRRVPEAIARSLFRSPVPSESGLGVGLYQAAAFAAKSGYQLELTDNRRRSCE